MCYKCGGPMDGAKGMCRPCKREYNREHYHANRQYYYDKARKRNEAQRQKIRDIKGSTPCTDCGIQYPYYVMDFDHRENKEFEINGNSTSKGWEVILAEIAKCDVVCSNCHRQRTHERACGEVETR